jgi:hypothetical protein
MCHISTFPSCPCPGLGPNACCWLLLLQRRCDERRVCFSAWGCPVWHALMTCGMRRVHRYRRVLVLVLLLLITVRVRLRLRLRCEPRLGPRLEHITGDTRKLIAVRRQMHIREALLCLWWVGQDIWRGLRCKRLGCMRRGVQLVDERCSATATPAEAAHCRRDRHSCGCCCGGCCCDGCGCGSGTRLPVLALILDCKERGLSESRSRFAEGGLGMGRGRLPTDASS